MTAQKTETALAYLTQHTQQTIDRTMLYNLSNTGITSALRDVIDTRTQSDASGDIIALGIAGKITKRGTSLCTELINDLVHMSTGTEKHLVVLLDPTISIDFSFYKLLTDFIVSKKIQSVDLVSQTADVCIDRGVDFIRKFTSNSSVQHLVDTALPIDNILEQYDTQSSVA